MCEFAYREDYTTPKPTSFEREDINLSVASLKYADPMGKVCNNLELSDYESDSEIELDVEVTKGNLPVHFQIRKFPLVGWSRKQFARAADIEPNRHWTQNFAPVFLGHARIYAFAHIYMIAELRNLALYKIHQTLKRFTLYASGCSAIVELARYAYDDNILPGRQGGEVDQLREMVVEYIAVNVEHFSEEQVHREFLAEGGEYAVDLLSKMIKWRL